MVEGKAKEGIEKDIEKLSVTVGNCVGLEGSDVSRYQDPTLLNAGKGLEDVEQHSRFNSLYSFDCCL